MWRITSDHKLTINFASHESTLVNRCCYSSTLAILAFSLLCTLPPVKFQHT
uniref:Uncharacterized protein n=1 Tax=Physcomitrium patens TaxID=3218 RepID=A0A2K1JPA4_PHYPA|nr:hypothetical protein PHYPA_015759 [Physcomitrium patens]